MQIFEKLDEYVPTGPDGSRPETGDKESLTLVCLVPKGMLPKEFDIESALVGAGITISIVQNIAKHENGDKYELVAARSCLELLSTRLQGFTLIADYDPFAPDDDVKRIYGPANARKRAQDTATAIAKQAKHEDWTTHSEECYRKIFDKAGWKQEFNEEVLGKDNQGANVPTIKLSELDEGLSITLPNIRETAQSTTESQLLNSNIDHQDTGPPQDGKVDELQGWTTVDKKDTELAKRGSEDEFARTLAYLKEVIRFGKQANDYMKILTWVEALPKESPAILNGINAQITVDYADLSNDFYTTAFENGQAVDVSHVGEQTGEEY